MYQWNALAPRIGFDMIWGWDGMREETDRGIPRVEDTEAGAGVRCKCTLYFGVCLKFFLIKKSCLFY